MEPHNEVDVVVTLPDGRWGAFEVKMNPADVDKAAAALVSFARKVDQGKAGPPEWLDFEGTRATYLSGLPEELQEQHPRESWHLDSERMSRPGHIEVH